MKDLRMSKDRFAKQLITDVAIEKVPYIEYENFTEHQNKIVRILAKEVLNISKEENDCNEVAITYRMADDDELDYGVSFGDEHSVEIGSDSYSNHLLQSTEKVIIVILHNHPSTQTLSYEDLVSFILYKNVKMMLVVTNQGNIHYIMKHPQYDFNEARKVMIKYAPVIQGAKDTDSAYESTKQLLKELKNMGLYYR